MDPRHVLIVKLSSIGDVVHALPVATALKRRFPSVRITWAAERWTAPLVEHHPAIDRVVVFPSMMQWPDRPAAWWSEMRAAARTLRNESYDAALDLQGLAKSAVITKLSRAPLRLARAGQREGAHLVSTSVPMPPTTIHAVDEYLLVGKAIGVDTESVDFGLTPSQHARASLDRLLTTHGVTADKPLIVVNASAAQSWKHWPAARWTDVIDRLADAGTVVVIGSASQASAHHDIATRAPRPAIDLTGHTTLAEVIALLARADLHLAPDTGTIHIAVALGTPVVGVYGPTSRVRVGPYGHLASAISRDDLCGSGCPSDCRLSRRCLDAVTVDAVVDIALSQLAKHRLHR